MDFFQAIHHFFSELGQLNIQPGALIAPLQYVSAFLVAVGFYVLQRTARRKLRWRVIMRAMFRKSQWLTRSTFVDCCYVLGNAFVFGAFVALAVLTSQGVYIWVHHLLVGIAGTPAPTTLSPGTATAIMMVVAYVCYEFGYFIDHFLCHKVRFLWEFHKVHHSATRLTPLTNSRMHPVDTIVFFNIIAVTIGTGQAVVGYLLGTSTSATHFPHNFFLMAYFYIYAHLQHTHIWMPLRGWAGRVFCSPAHHQIHHSTNPRHFDKNFGSSLVVFDWLFGTLYIPAKKREVDQVGLPEDPHLQGFLGSLFMPFVTAPRYLLPKAVRRKLRPPVAGLETRSF